MTRSDMARDFPLGSRWYAWGHHWEIVDYGTRDGEPSLLMKITTRSTPTKYRRVKHNTVARLFARKAIRTDEGR
jgi:hypothetical protein